MNRRALVAALALAPGLVACGRRGSPRMPKRGRAQDDEDDETATVGRRPPPPEFEQRDDE